MASAQENVEWLARDLHYQRVRTGYYRNMVTEATGTSGFGKKTWGPMAKTVGVSGDVLAAMLDGTVEPTVDQFKRLQEALRTIVAQPVNGTPS